MKNEPCIRLGMRIRPKMSEKPDDSRNSKPPSAMLFTANVSHRLIQWSQLGIGGLRHPGSRRIAEPIQDGRSRCLRRIWMLRPPG